MSKVTDILQEAAAGVLTEETLQAIEAAFTESVDQKAEERSQLAVKAALSEQDEKYADKLQELLESIDRDHSRKFKRVVESIEKDRTNKLKAVIRKYESELNESARSLRDSVVESVSEFLDVALDEAIPAESIAEAVKNKRAFDVLSDLRNTLGVDLALAQESVKSGIIDGKRQLDESRQLLEAANTERDAAASELADLKRDMFLSEKLEGVDRAEAAFIKEQLADKSVEFIKEHYEHTSKLFAEKQETRKQSIRKSALRKSVLKRVDEKALDSDAQESKSNRETPDSPYLQELKRFL